MTVMPTAELRQVAVTFRRKVYLAGYCVVVFYYLNTRIENDSCPDTAIYLPVYAAGAAWC